MITQSRLKEQLHYDEKTGVFKRLISNCGRIKIGDIAGNKSNGYIRMIVSSVEYSAHRLAWLYVYGESPPNHIDHINHNRADNRIANLRCVSCQDNAKNKKMHCGNTSGTTGVYRNNSAQKWYAQICVDGKNKHLGTFVNKTEAINARKDANIKYGFHKNHGVGK